MKSFWKSKITTEINASDVSTVYNADEYLIVNLKDSNGNPISGVNVTVDLDGAETYVTDDNGQVKVQTKGLLPENYTATVTFNGSDIYAGSTKNVNVTVKKATSNITAKSKKYKITTKTKKYKIKLKDCNGNPIKNTKVYLKVNGKTYAAKTNSKGKATFKITALTKTGTFKAKIKFKGNDYYEKVSKKVSFKVVWKTVQKGSTAKTTVKKIQKALKKHGYYITDNGYGLKVDSIYIRII